MADNTEKLVLLMEAQNKDVLRKINQIERSSKKSFNNARKPLRSFNRDMKAAANSARGLAAAFAGGFSGVLIGGGIASLPGIVRDVVGEASKLGKVADKVNLTTDALQRLRYGLELTGVGVNQTDTALQRFARRVAQAANGSGELFEILRQNNLALRNQDGSMRSQIEILRDYADLINRAGSEQEQLLLAFKAFDTEGAGFVNGLKNGAVGLDILMQKADDAGGVLDESIVREAERIDDAFAGLWRNFEINAKSAILSATRGISDLVALVQNSDFVQWLNRVENIGREAEVKASIDVLRDAGAAESALQGLQHNVDILKDKIPHNEKIGFDTAEAEEKLDKLISKVNALKTSPAGLANVDPSLLPVDQKDGEATERPPRVPGRKPAVRNFTVVPTGGSGRNVEDRQADSVKRLIAALELERDAIGRTAVEQRLMNEIARAGAGATDAQKEQIRALVTEIESAESSQRALTEATQFFQGQAMTAFGTITSQINTGNAALDRFLSTLIEASAQAAFFGQGPLAGKFGGGGGGLLGGVGKLFGGFFADGGHLGAGKYGIAGEAGPELIKGPANVVPMSKAGGSTTTIVKVVPSDMFDVIVDGKAQQAAATGYAMAANDMSRNFSSYQQRNQVNKGT